MATATATATALVEAEAGLVVQAVAAWVEAAPWAAQWPEALAATAVGWQRRGQKVAFSCAVRPPREPHARAPITARGGRRRLRRRER